MKKTIILFSLLIVSVFMANSTFAAEDKKVNLNIAHSMNQIITYDHCMYNSELKDKKLVVLTDIISEEEAKVKNLFDQNRICGENYIMKVEQAEDWKKETKELTEELIKAKDWPWWKFDLKSMGLGSILTLISLILI